MNKKLSSHSSQASHSTNPSHPISLRVTSTKKLQIIILCYLQLSEHLRDPQPTLALALQPIAVSGQGMLWHPSLRSLLLLLPLLPARVCQWIITTTALFYLSYPFKLGMLLKLCQITVITRWYSEFIIKLLYLQDLPHHFKILQQLQPLLLLLRRVLSRIHFPCSILLNHSTIHYSLMVVVVVVVVVLLVLLVGIVNEIATIVQSNEPTKVNDPAIAMLEEIRKLNLDADRDLKKYSMNG